ncbi:serine hydrolase domain-containing protein [Paenibacillus puerhi]|uniref:serine hydrolase domain-containing protein n=1 Tax=Paenibacillus puerhi TaxID=2692622 RepID=UPI001359D6E9|nr:serine hydrolase [Paenibacillus puerhi]
MKKLPRSVPEQQGMSSDSIVAFLDAVDEEEFELHSIMIVRNGHVVTEGWWKPYEAESPHLLNSLSKSFTSTAVGIAEYEGLLSLDDQVISFFPELVTEEIESNMKDMKIRHLLSMSTGHDQDTTFVMWEDHSNWAKVFLEMPIKHEPGTHFLYNTGATYMLSAILERVSGQKLLDFLRPRLFDPLGIQDVPTISCPQGVHVGGFGMSMRTEDIAKFGQLYLQNGVWEGVRILPEGWVQAATSKQVSNGDDEHSDWSQGYGYQFWRCRHDSYRGDGAFGQFCIVMPKQNAVIAITAGLMEMQDVLALVWKHLLPGMTDRQLLPESARYTDLSTRLNALSYVSDQGVHRTPFQWRSHSAAYSIAPNANQFTQAVFSEDEQEISLSLIGDKGSFELRAGLGCFSYGEGELNGFSFNYAACGTWRKRNVLDITLFMTQYPLSDRITCHFVSDSVQITSTRNVWKSPILSDMGIIPTLSGSKFSDRDTWIGNTKQE